MEDKKGQGVDRIFDIIEAVAANPDGLSLTKIAVAVNLPKSTAHRLVGFLINKNYLEKDGEDYRLGYRFIAVAGDYYSRLDLRRIASPFLRSLAAETGGTAHLAVRQGEFAVYIDKVQPFSYACMYSEIGKGIELYCSALGKSLLSGFEAEELNSYYDRLKPIQYTENTLTVPQLQQEIISVRLAGVSFDNAEHEENCYCVAAPVFDFCGKVIAAVSLTVRSRAEIEDKKIQSAVKERANAISRYFGSKTE